MGLIQHTEKLYRTVGQEPDERDEELSSFGNSCRQRGLDGRPTAGPQLDFALLAHDDHHRISVGRC